MREPWFRRALPDQRWEQVPVLAYKEDNSPFRAVTRQVLFDGDVSTQLGGLPVQLRYFEVGPGGHTTLERHHHVHLVWISRGRGRVYLGGIIRDLAEGDVLSVPTLTWHQFRAPDDVPLGFHCLVAVERDKPQLPDDSQWLELTADDDAALFLRRNS